MEQKVQVGVSPAKFSCKGRKSTDLGRGWGSRRERSTQSELGWGQERQGTAF